MPAYRSLMARAFVLAGAVGVAWLVQRRPAGTPPRLVDWERVQSVALRLNSEAQPMSLPTRRHMQRKYYGWVRQSEEGISEYLQQEAPSSAGQALVFDRKEWINANRAQFEALFDPLERANEQGMLDARAGSWAMARMSQLVISYQMGLLMGYLGRRVLGQYDVALLGREPLTGGRIYFVEPNIAGLERRLRVPGEDLRLWISLHETTHAFEFEGHPWLIEYLNGLLGQYFENAATDFRSLKTTGIWEMVGRTVKNSLTQRSPLEAIMSDVERDVFGRIQAVMSLLEGFSNHVMDRVGERIMPANYPALKSRFETRRGRRSMGDRLFAKFTGLELKLEQYRLGEQFVNQIVAERGLEVMGLVWKGPEFLPDMREIRQPTLWYDRVRKL